MTPKKYTLHRTEKFIRSFEKAIAYYRDEVDSPDIGRRFVATVKEAVQKIHDNPNRAPYYVPHPVYKDVLEEKLRAFQLGAFSPFPYVLYYSVQKNKITLHYLFHASQDRSHLTFSTDFHS